MSRLTPPGIAATARSAVGRKCGQLIRLTPPGIAATARAEALPEARVLCPPHAPRNCGDCAPIHGTPKQDNWNPPHAPRNCGDCAFNMSAVLCNHNPPHAPRNCGDCARSSNAPASGPMSRLTPPGIAATARKSSGVPHCSRRLRLTPPGIAATARDHQPRSGVSAHPASRPPELRRLRAVGDTVTIRETNLPPHAPRNCGDCAQIFSRMSASLQPRLTPPGIAATARTFPEPLLGHSPTASRPPELRRLREVRTMSARSFFICRLTPPGIAATARHTTTTGNRRVGVRLTPPGIAATARTGALGGRLVRTFRLTPPGIAATARSLAAFSTSSFWVRLTPPGIAATARGTNVQVFLYGITASRPPELRRLRADNAGVWNKNFARLTPPGIAATARWIHVGG